VGSTTKVELTTVAVTENDVPRQTIFVAAVNDRTAVLCATKGWADNTIRIIEINRTFRANFDI